MTSEHPMHRGRQHRLALVRRRQGFRGTVALAARSHSSSNSPASLIVRADTDDIWTDQNSRDSSATPRLCSAESLADFALSANSPPSEHSEAEPTATPSSVLGPAEPLSSEQTGHDMSQRSSVPATPETPSPLVVSSSDSPHRSDSDSSDVESPTATADPTTSAQPPPSSSSSQSSDGSFEESASPTSPENPGSSITPSIVPEVSSTENGDTVPT